MKTENKEEEIKIEKGKRFFRYDLDALPSEVLSEIARIVKNNDMLDAIHDIGCKRKAYVILDGLIRNINKESTIKKIVKAAYSALKIYENIDFDTALSDKENDTNDEMTQKTNNEEVSYIDETNEERDKHSFVLDLDSLTSEALSGLARIEKSNIILCTLYDIACERKSNIILNSLLENPKGGPHIRRIVEKVAEKVQEKCENNGFDPALYGKKTDTDDDESKKRNFIDLKTCELISLSYYTPVETLTALLYEGIVTALFNSSTSRQAINEYLKADETLDWIAYNPSFIGQFVNKCGYKLDDSTFEHLCNIPYEGSEMEIQKLKLDLWCEFSFRGRNALPKPDLAIEGGGTYIPGSL